MIPLWLVKLSDLNIARSSHEVRSTDLSLAWPCQVPGATLFLTLGLTNLAEDTELQGDFNFNMRLALLC